MLLHCYRMLTLWCSSASKRIMSEPISISLRHTFFSLSALQTFHKETDDGEELMLHGSEVASLMNLVATDTLVEEAVALIPSLARFPEAAMDEILDLIRSTMIRIVS
jgi:hypothetical protein